MEQQKTELVCILDRSGSMGGLESDTIGGFNSFIEKQKQDKGDVILTTLLFDHHIEVLHDRMNLQAVSPLSERDYYVRGNTALLDAIGYGIEKIANVQAMSSDEHKADKVIVVITTDGMENASHLYRIQDIRRMIKDYTERDHWEFVFMGANIDAVETARDFGIDPDRAVRFHNDSEGIKLNYATLDRMVKGVKDHKEFSKDWKKDIEEDFAKRTK